MGHKNKSIFVFLKESGQPKNMWMIQIIGRFIQDKYGRIFQKEFYQQHLGALPTGEIRNVFVKAYIAETQSSCNFLYFGIKLIKS